MGSGNNTGYGDNTGNGYNPGNGGTGDTGEYWIFLVYVYSGANFIGTLVADFDP